jgi:hypothetical protein
MENTFIPTVEFLKIIRNNRLIESDIEISNIEDETEMARWVEYRQKLRDYFVDKDDSYFQNNQVIWPRTPRDVDALKAKAAEGDAESIEIVQKDGL